MSEWILQQSGLIIYIALFLSLMGGAIGLPIPEDIPLIAGGIAVNRGIARVEIVFIICYLAILLGDLIIYLVGRRFGPSLFKQNWFRSRIPPSKIKKVRLSLERRSLLMIFIARHLFYLRTVTFLTCGAVRMKPQRFFVADACAALISVPLMMGLGYFAAAHIDTALHYAKHVEIALGVVLLCVVLYFIYRKRQKKREQLLQGQADLCDPKDSSVSSEC